MKQLYIIFLFFSISLFSQDLDRIKKNNTIFILYDINEEYQKKYSCESYKSAINNCSYNYIFLEENRNTLNKEVITFLFKKFENFDEKDRENPVPVFHVNKRFIKNNKDMILNINNLHKIGYRESLELFRNTKHIFLIDTSEMENNQVTIKEVFLIFNVE